MRNRGNRRKKFIVFLFFIVTVAGLLLFVNWVRSPSKDPIKIISPIVDALTTNPFRSEKNIDPLSQIIQQQLTNKDETFGIVIKNLKTGESFLQNEHLAFKSGSLYKLWIMATAFQQIKSGKFSEDDILTQEISVLNDKFRIASESAEKTEGTLTLSVNDALSQMIRISDNYSALILTEKVRLTNVASFLQTYGFTESQVGITGGDPITTPSDIALFFEKLYKEEIIDKDYSNKMLALLKKQNLNGKIPKYLPDKTIAAHKTGELDEFTHDAGIIYTPYGDYIIVVLAKSNSREDANEEIAHISQVVYEYFTKK